MEGLETCRLTPFGPLLDPFWTPFARGLFKKLRTTGLSSQWSRSETGVTSIVSGIEFVSSVSRDRLEWQLIRMFDPGGVASVKWHCLEFSSSSGQIIQRTHDPEPIRSDRHM